MTARKKKDAPERSKPEERKDDAAARQRARDRAGEEGLPKMRGRGAGASK